MSETYTIGDGRAQTAIAMAKGEAWALRGWLEHRAAILRQEADEIDVMLEKSTKHTDGWYETLCKERDDARRNLRNPVNE